MFSRWRKSEYKRKFKQKRQKKKQFLGPGSPEPERGTPGEEDGLGFGFGLLKQSEEGVVFDADLPEYLAAVPAGHGELQRVVVGVLLDDTKSCAKYGLRGGENKRTLILIKRNIFLK